MSLDLNSVAVVHQAELEGFPESAKSDLNSSARIDLTLTDLEGDESSEKNDNLGAKSPDFSTKLALSEKDVSFEFSVCDLVWGKVRSHPWWPGQIYDPSFASDMALKHQKKDHFLVAYFGDKTFAWNDKSKLKPFESFFSQMEKQSNVDEFVEAVDRALGEFSRRVEIGLTCGCIADGSKLQSVENAGIREGTCFPAVDRCTVASLFEPCGLVEYIHGLAQVPLGDFDKLEFVKVVAQLKAIYMSKGYSELAGFCVGGGLCYSEEVSAHERGEDGILSNETSLKENRRGRGRPRGKKKAFEEDGRRMRFKKNGILLNDTSLKEKRRSRGRPFGKGKVIDEDARSMEYTQDGIFSNETFSEEKKRGRGRPPGKKKGIEEDGRKQRSLPELMEQTAEKYEVKVSSKFSNKHIISVPDSVGFGRCKKKRLNSLGDVGSIPDSLSSAKGSRIGPRISRVAKEMKFSRSEHNDVKVNQVKSRTNGRTSFGHGNSKSPRSDKALMQDYPAPSEMLSQLCFVAKGPMKAHRFQSIVNFFFVNWRDSRVPDSVDDDKPLDLLESRKVLAESELVPVEVKSDYVLDSYWSDFMFEENPKKEGTSRGRKRKANFEMNQTKKTKAEGISSLSSTLEPTLSTSELLSDKQQQEERLGNLSDDKAVEECNPAALILIFNDPDGLPSESDLIRIFSQYGPLKEAETEVSRKSRRASVVFKRGADAEVAFSSSGKFNAFGPTLVSYRLRYSTSSSPGTTPKEDPSSETGGTAIVPEDSAVVVPTDGKA